jgi:hypothetical protein
MWKCMISACRQFRCPYSTKKETRRNCGLNLEPFIFSVSVLKRLECYNVRTYPVCLFLLYCARFLPMSCFLWTITRQTYANYITKIVYVLIQFLDVLISTISKSRCHHWYRYTRHTPTLKLLFIFVSSILQCRTSYWDNGLGPSFSSSFLQGLPISLVSR